MSDTPAIAATRVWLERAVIGLNLCPFARAPYVQRRVRFVESPATDVRALHDDLRAELERLRDTPAETVETTLLIHPHVLQSFLDYNDFLDLADALVEDLGLDGELQVASFHPDYRFADAEPDAIENHTNRAPYPILHLLREASIARVVDAIDDPDAIYERNIATLRRLGREGWNALWNDDAR
ncbi:DUF1415 family protein [Chiayiivirga flava]|uniref:DUF1415 domain-containing protein n=1 Tax=Chiayiivirga flava TaxID=659595 RepID=A0A7W8G232_9GAMM|nr:hypothetical protein [Chiayiivirga flava]